MSSCGRLRADQFCSRVESIIFSSPGSIAVQHRRIIQQPAKHLRYRQQIRVFLRCRAGVDDAAALLQHRLRRPVECAIGTHGITRDRRSPAIPPPALPSNVSAPGEVAQHRQPDALALLRVELRGEDVVVPDRRGERRRVVGLGRDERRVASAPRSRSGRSRPTTPSGRSREQRRRPADAQLVPAHVRHLQARHVGEAHHVAGEEVEPRVLAVLVAAW